MAKLGAQTAPAVAQAFQPAGSRDFPVPCFRSGTGDWKVARTRRQECLRYVTLLRHKAERPLRIQHRSAGERFLSPGWEARLHVRRGCLPLPRPINPQILPEQNLEVLNGIDGAGTDGSTQDNLRQGRIIHRQPVGAVKLGVGQELLRHPRVGEGGLQFIRAHELRGVFAGQRQRRRFDIVKHPVVKLAVDFGFGPPNRQAQARIFTSVRVRARVQVAQ